MPSYIVVPLILFVVIGMYLLSYTLNKNTKVPEGITPESKCSTCGSGSCSLVGSNTTEPLDDCELETVK